MEVHCQSRLVNMKQREGFRCSRIAKRRTDTDVFNTVDKNDISCLSFINNLSFQTLELQDLIDFGSLRNRIRTVHNDNFLERFDFASFDAADTDLANVA